MKKVIFMSLILAILASWSLAITVDGTVDAGYGSAKASDAILPTSGEGGAGGNAPMDLKDLYITDDISTVYIAFVWNGDGSTNWGKYCFYLESPGVTAAADSATYTDQWARPAGYTGSWAPNVQFHSWVDSGGGGGCNKWDGAAWAAINSQFAFSLANSCVEVGIPKSEIGIVDYNSIKVEVWATGGGSGDNIQDTVPSDINATDWGTKYYLQSPVTYTMGVPVELSDFATE